MAKDTAIPSFVEQKLAALDRAFTRAVREHARKGVSVVLERNGRMVDVSPDELLEEASGEECVGESKRPA